MVGESGIESYRIISFYQLENLVKNRVKFVFLDLREVRVVPEGFDANLLHEAQSVAPEAMLDSLRAAGTVADAAIVVICENRAKSVDALRALEQNSFFNAFVVDASQA